MMRSSEAWKMICPNCGHAVSVWESGGIRWGAKSVGKRVAGRCPACGTAGMMPLEKRP
ncbi:hypothetical protein [Rhodobacter sp. JA431]|uniref:hypothetical protein n=1 Tax=Rhodobacter sp. JA431 TaxID=570013 RepID=UPI0014827DFE|nr:hypothetical protein [Rhodobacter sp. JA431]